MNSLTEMTYPGSAAINCAIIKRGNAKFVDEVGRKDLRAVYARSI